MGGIPTPEASRAIAEAARVLTGRIVTEDGFTITGRAVRTDPRGTRMLDTRLEDLPDGSIRLTATEPPE